MGPHGLLAWSSGAGKSELIRTLILGLALTHSPNVVNFLLVGFRGGVTARGLNNLPHISEIVTDADRTGQLDEALRRELSRRQELLRSAADGFRSHREYKEAWARGAPLEPLPALIVLVDAVFELQQLRPELIDVLNEIGWKGRALGVHLLLVAERINRSLLRRAESYLSYRICLRTNSPDDSEAVLGNTDGYDLPTLPGHGFLMVGTATYQRFRAAYTGDDADTIVRRLASYGSDSGPVARPIGVEAASEPVPQPVSTAPLRERLELVVAHVIAETGQIVMRSEQLFGAGAQVGAERTLTLWLAHADDEGTVLAVVVWRDGRPRVLSIDSVRVAPGSHRLRAVLAGPGRVKFVEPPGVEPDQRSWSQLMATVPRRFTPPVGEFDLICALDLSGDGFADRRALVSALIELLRDEYPEPGRFRVAVVGYRPHEFRMGAEGRSVVSSRWLASAESAQDSLDRLRAFAPGKARAAPVEDALAIIARGVDRIPTALKVVLLTVGERPPHPPGEEPGGEIACPLEHDWRTLLGRVQRHKGLSSVVVLDSAQYLDDTWQRLGSTALHQLSRTDPHKLATAAGLLIPPAKRLSFPLLEPPDSRS
jgi:hypothetical protein